MYFTVYINKSKDDVDFNRKLKVTQNGWVIEFFWLVLCHHFYYIIFFSLKYEENSLFSCHIIQFIVNRQGENRQGDKIQHDINRINGGKFSNEKFNFILNHFAIFVCDCCNKN